MKPFGAMKVNILDPQTRPSHSFNRTHTVDVNSVQPLPHSVLGDHSTTEEVEEPSVDRAISPMEMPDDNTLHFLDDYQQPILSPTEVTSPNSRVMFTSFYGVGSRNEGVQRYSSQDQARMRRTFLQRKSPRLITSPPRLQSPISPRFNAPTAATNATMKGFNKHKKVLLKKQKMRRMLDQKREFNVPSSIGPRALDLQRQVWMISQGYQTQPLDLQNPLPIIPHA